MCPQAFTLSSIQRWQEGSETKFPKKFIIIVIIITAVVSISCFVFALILMLSFFVYAQQLKCQKQFWTDLQKTRNEWENGKSGKLFRGKYKNALNVKYVRNVPIMVILNRLSLTPSRQTEWHGVIPHQLLWQRFLFVKGSRVVLPWFSLSIHRQCNEKFLGQGMD